MEIIDYKLRIDGHWYGLFKDPVTIDGEVIDERDWRIVMITDVPVDVLLKEWHFLVHELSDKEVELVGKKEDYNRKEFEIVYQSDINFKELYGSTSEKVRKQHAKTVLVKLDGEIQSLELSINWIKQYIPLLREVIKVKQS